MRPGRIFPSLVALRLAVLLVLLPACLSGSAGAPSPEDIFRLQTRSTRWFVFPSGLEVRLERDASLPAVALVAVVGAGSTRDPAGKEGLAHAVEHLSFLARQGDGRTRGRTLSDLGATWNASTSWDETTYYEFGPREALPRLLDLESARLLDPIGNLTERDLAGERDVIRNELLLSGETQVIGQVIGWLQAAALPATDPYVRPVVGTEASLSALTLADARAFAANYRPADISLYILGDINLDAARELLGRLPAALTGGAPTELSQGSVRRRPRQRLNDPPSQPVGAAALPRYRAAVAGPQVWVAWTLPGAYAETAGVAHLLANAADAALDEHDLRGLDISSADVFTIEGVRETLLVCRGWLISGADPDRAFDALAGRVSQKWRETVYDERWYSYLRGEAAARLLVDEDGLGARALTAATLAHFVGDPDWLRRRAAALATIDYSVAADFAERYILKKSARGVFVAPLPPEARPAPRAVGVDRAVTSPPTGPDATLAARLRSTRGLGEVKRARLRNGLEVVAIERPGTTMTVLLGFHGGLADGPVPGVAQAFSYAAEFQVVRPPSTFGMIFSRRYSRDDVVEVLRGPVISLDSALQFLKQEEEVFFDWPSRLLFRRAPAIAQFEDSPNARAERALTLGLLGGHPYGGTPLVKDVLRVNVQQVRTWWLAHRRPDNALLVVVGDFDGAKVVTAARDALGSWRAPTAPPGGPPTPPPPVLSAVDRPGNVIITHRPGAVQAEITMACLLPPVAGGDPTADDLLASAIGDDLWTKLRENLGGTYDVTTHRTALRGGATYLSTRTAIDNSHLPAALSIIRDYWRRGREPLAPQVIEAARWNGARRGFLAFATTAALAREVFNYWNFGWPLEEMEKYPQRLAEVPAEALAPVRDACHANFVLSIVGDEPTIRASWR